MKSKKKKTSGGIIAGRVVLVALTTIVAILLALVVIIGTIVKGPSIAARDTFVTTVLESGNLKFLAHVFLSSDEINEIVEKTSMGQMDTDIDQGLINTDTEVEGDFDENGVEIVTINGSNYYATMLIVKDPSKVQVGTSYNSNNGYWGEYGENIDDLVIHNGAIGGVNGGIYVADLNKGGSPYGVCVSRGLIEYNDPSGYPYYGMYMIGLDNSNILRIVSIEGWSPDQFSAYVYENGIRDAVAFQDEASDANNHFVPLIINGEARELNGAGSGANPRTVIGQREDGAILLLVTDGRGKSGHLGATASDLISIMLKYGAVNAANLDGGSSSCMYYNGKMLMDSVTLWATNSSWKLPTGFVIMK
ncbi:MAG: phosphodiester glycosidase family protein [Firmicutes bacterium]|nr:phosphodiester glycosidase family protein [Bacillota bacterium]